MLEPVVKMDVTIPEANVEVVYSDMSSRGGRVAGSDSAGGDLQTVHCEVPLSCVTTYAPNSLQHDGRAGELTMDFSHYDVMAPNVMQEVIGKSKLEKKRKTERNSLHQ